MSEQAKYISDHPEIQQMLHDFVASCLVHKPHNVHAHAVEFFSKYASDGGPQFISHLQPIVSSLRSSVPASSSTPISGPRPLVVCGPSGVGKGTLLKQLLHEFGNVFAPVVSHTSRAPRPGEEDGIHYHFSSFDEMKRDIDAGLFIEHAKVHQNLYGKSRRSVENVQTQGKVCLLELDVQGAETIKTTDLNANFLFIAPPSLELLEERLRGRGTETEDQLRVRLAGAHREMSYLQRQGFFDAVVVNDDFDAAYRDLLTALKQFYPQFL